MRKSLALLAALGLVLSIGGPALGDHHNEISKAAAKAAAAEAPADQASGGCQADGGCCGQAACAQAKIQAKEAGSAGGCPCKNKQEKDD